MVRREEQRWRNRVVLLLDNRARAHTGAGAGSSFEYAASAMASIGVHLARGGLDGQLITVEGPATEPGSFEDSLLDSLAVVGQSRTSELTAGLDRVPGGTGGLFMVVAGRLSADEARRLAAGRRDAGPAMALLLAVSTWAPRQAGDPAEADGSASILRAAGWRVATVSAGTPMTEAWQRLSQQPALRGAPGVPADRRGSACDEPAAHAGRGGRHDRRLALAVPAGVGLALVLGRRRRRHGGGAGRRPDPAARAAASRSARWPGWPGCCCT